jgi:hypothetical protein
MNEPMTSSPLPDWAVERVRASLKIGLGVPEIERGLVEKGLTPAEAEAVVTSVLENRVQDQLQPQADAEIQQRVHRILSAVIGCACLGLGYWYGGGYSTAKVALGILVPVSCVWVPDWMASSTPAFMIRLGGWLLLIVIFMYRLTLVMITSEN